MKNIKIVGQWICFDRTYYATLHILFQFQYYICSSHVSFSIRFGMMYLEMYTECSQIRWVASISKKRKEPQTCLVLKKAEYTILAYVYLAQSMSCEKEVM